MSLARVLLAGTVLIFLGAACRPKPGSPSPESNGPAEFRARGPKRLTLDGVDFFEHERGLLVGRAPRNGIAQRWQRLHDEAVKIGRWPILMDGLSLSKGELSDENRESPEQILSTAEQFNREQWLDRERRQQQESHAEETEAGDGNYDPLYYVAWPDQIERFANESIFPARTKFEHIEYSMDHSDKPVTVALLPTIDSWKVYAYIPNDLQPRAEISTGILKGWHERYGAEVVMMSLEGLNLWVPEPVQDTQEVCRLAEEQFFFCPELVDDSGSKFAADLRRHRIWVFWWD